MNTFLLIWNPAARPWSDMDKDIADIQKNGMAYGAWSLEGNPQIQNGDRVFFLRGGSAPCGIMASGHTRSSCVQGDHPFEAGRTAWHVKIRFDAVLDAGARPILEIQELEEKGVDGTGWQGPADGVLIPPGSAAKLEAVWREFLAGHENALARPPEEVSAPGKVDAGAVRQVSVNAYERDPRACEKCIRHHGATCSVCGFNFGEFFGNIGRGFIRAHHIMPLPPPGKEYTLNPVKDMRPVCPNCHAMLHRTQEPMKIEDLKARLKSHRAGKTA